LRKRISIVHEQSGVTRDRVVAPGEYQGRRFLLVDTGGLGVHHKERTTDLFDGMIREQVAQVVAEAAVLIWVVNIQDGITTQDEEVADFLRKSGKPVVVAANKGDNAIARADAVGLFAALGYEDIVPTSCTHSLGVGDLMETVLRLVPASGQEGEAAAESEAGRPLRVAVVGRPNVGKSSLVNRLLGENRVMVSDIPGTTRDAIDIPVTLECDGVPLPLTLIDTAGMRRQKQIDTVVEFFSLSRSKNAIRRADLVIFMIDATDPCTTQDRRIGHVVVEERKPCILLGNKWDLAERGVKTQDVEARIRQDMPFMNHAPVLLLSVLKGFNLREITSRLVHVREQMGVSVPTAVFNQFLQDTLARTPPPSTGLKRFKIFYGTMKGGPPPKFILFVNKRSLCPHHYLQVLENQIRDAFYPEAGLPIVIELRERESHQGDSAGAVRRAAAGAKRSREQDYQSEQRRITRRKGLRNG
jgi:GTP-binding protein